MNRPGDSWGAIDSSSNPESFIRFLDRTSTGPGETHSAMGLLGLQPGQRGLDVGCGTGEDTRAMAALGAEVIGVDLSGRMVQQARIRSTGRRGLTFLAADACDLPFAQASFHAVWIKRTLMHLADSERAVAEAARVLVPGGRIVAVEPDTEPLLVDSEMAEVTRRMQAFGASQFANPRVGRQLRRLLLDAGFADVRVFPEIAAVTGLAEARLDVLARLAAERGAVTEDEAAQWVDKLLARDRRGVFAYYRLGFVATGRTAGR